MPFKSLSFRTRCANQRLLSTASSKPKRLRGRRVPIRSQHSSEAPCFAPAPRVSAVKNLVTHGAVPDAVQAPSGRTSKRVVDLVPLDKEVRDYLPTNEAAYHLGRKPQTLRVWSCNETGLLQPIGRGARLLWPVAGIKALLIKDAEKAKSKAAAKDVAKKKDGVSDV